MKKSPNLPGTFCTLVFYIVFAAQLSAGWRSNRFVSVPIPPPNQPVPVPLSGGYALNTTDIEGDVAAADLATLKRFAPFAGLTDAEVRSKMNVIRRNVSRAIILLAQEDADLSYCLSRLWHQRRLCIAFTRGNFGGITNANSFPNVQDPCERAAIAINIERIPCDLRKAYDGDMLTLMNTMGHEALHVTQQWSGNIPPRLPQNNAEIDLRLEIQENEIAASTAEKVRLQNLRNAFETLRDGGSIPPPNDINGADILPLTRRAVRDFLRDTPAAERAARAGEIYDALHRPNLVACLTTDCRKAVKIALERLKQDGDTAAFLRTIRGSSGQNSWFSFLGNRVLTGVFQTDIFAGGLGDDTNKIRQYVEGVENEIVIPKDFLTDIHIYDHRSLFVTASDTDGLDGTIYLVSDSDGDHVLDSVMPTLTHQYLRGGVSFVDSPEGSPVSVFGRETQMIFHLTLGTDGNLTYPIGIGFGGTIGNPSTDLIQNVVIDDDGLGGVGIEYEDFALFPGTYWREFSRLSLAGTFSSGGDIAPVEDIQIEPAIVRWPWEGDSMLYATGTAGEMLTFEVCDEAGMLVDSVTVPADEEGRAGALFALGMAGGLREPNSVKVKSSTNGVSRALAVAGGVDPSTEILRSQDAPVFDINGRFAVRSQWQPRAIARHSWALDGLGGWRVLDSAQTDGFVYAHFSDRIRFKQPPVGEVGMPMPRSFYRSELRRGDALNLSDDTLCVPPGIRSRVSLAMNDRYPGGTVFGLEGTPPLHRDIFRVTLDGHLEIAPLATDTSITFTYRATWDAGSATAMVTVQVKKSLLTEGSSLLAGRSRWVECPCCA